MKRLFALIATLSFTLAAHAAPSIEDLKKQVADTERAFAATMKNRDFEGFKSFLAEDTVFFSGPKPLHGKDEVAAFWKRLYEAKEAPFSWEPQEVEVVGAGNLGFSAGPVYSPTGQMTNRYSSIWRLESDGKWRIVFDHGWPVGDKKP